MAFPPISILGEKRSKIRTGAAKHFEGLAALSTHSAGRRAAVKAGCKPVHSSLDGCPLSCYFSGNVATTSGHFVHKSERRTRDGAFIYLPPFSEPSPIFFHSHSQKFSLFSCRSKRGARKHRTPFLPSATPAGITHYTLQAKSCANGGKPPLETPTRKGGMRPVEG